MLFTLIAPLRQTKSLLRILFVIPRTIRVQSLTNIISKNLCDAQHVVSKIDNCSGDSTLLMTCWEEGHNYSELRKFLDFIFQDTKFV